MKQTEKIFLGLSVVAFVSMGATAMTKSNVLVPDKHPVTFSEAFQQNPKSHTVDVAVQPVDLTKASELAVHAVVHIRSTKASKVITVEDDPFSRFFSDPFGFGDDDSNNNSGSNKRQMKTQPQVGIGSGVIISQDGYIVTNNHVVEGADEIEVTLNDNRSFKGRIIGTDVNTDLALIKIEGKDFPTLPVGDSDALKVGEWVIAVGNPFNLTSTVTAGIVSAKARSLGMNSIESFIQTDAAINQGNSGGALVNVKGELIGINAILSSPTGTNTGYGFAIPSNMMKKVVTDLKTYGTVQRAVLGIEGGSFPEMQEGASSDEELNKVQTEMKNLGVVDGVVIRKITEGGAASGADLKVNDVIVGVNGNTVHKMADLQGALSKMRPGQTVKLKIVRDKKEKEVSVTLKNEQGTTKVMKNEGIEILGAAFREVPASLKKQLSLSYGIEVTGVTKGKMMDAGIRKGFIILKVNGEAVHSVAEFEAAFKAASKSPEQVLFLSGMFPSGKRANFAVSLSDDDNTNK
jgi:Do/DeqQ family serine protease